jgi:hypothetical protein
MIDWSIALELLIEAEPSAWSYLLLDGLLIPLPEGMKARLKGG